MTKFVTISQFYLETPARDSDQGRNRIKFFNALMAMTLFIFKNFK